MSFPGQGGFPGMGAVPGAPQAPQIAGVGGGFVLDIPADPTWEPFETTDTLEKDGYYACRVTKESPRNDSSKSSGVFVTLELQDDDVKGKIISKFLPDPRTTKGNTWWIWRSLIRSITGGLDQARATFRYAPGAFVGQIVYVKTEAYNDDGVIRTGAGGFVTRAEWEEAVKGGKHRWAATVKSPAAGPSALPGGLPSAFPTSAFPGLPGAPSAPSPMGAPMQGAPPMMQQPPQQPPQQPQQPPPAFQAPPAQQAPASSGFPGFPPQASPFGAPPAQAAPAQAPSPFAGAVPSQPFGAFAAAPAGAPLQQPFAAGPGQQYAPPPATTPQPGGALPPALFPGTAPPNGTVQ